ncbi:MAG: LPS export ABC transporter periplasmic protein LptC [Muribaculaceae bacterium]|nr:LPS export ABC transporter periplasmic protein LptC [Muribaculaceae bacterium]
MSVRPHIFKDKARIRAVIAGACMLVLAAPAMLVASGAPFGAVQAPQQPAPTEQNKREPIKPTVPGADRYQPGKVFLEHADRLYYQETPGGVADMQYQVLVGNVKLRRNDMFMYCDSARFYETSNSLDAFGNVRMQQGDTLFVYADELDYNGRTEMAILYADFGKKVRLINRDVKLETDVFNYDMARNVGYYNIGGVLTDKANRLTSIEGEYYPDTKYAYFYTDVLLESREKDNELTMRTDSLIYNTATHIAELISPTEIVNADGTIESSSGMYNTNSGVADLYSRSMVRTRKGNTLTGDTLFYDRNKQYGEAIGNMILTDSARQTSLHGDYGYYDEVRDSAFVTGRAMAKEYSREDTLFLHGDTINAYLDLNDSTRVTNAYHGVRFYRSDIQGVCDSMSVTERDSLMYMYRAPIVWSGERQITGNVILVHMNDSTVDWARVPQDGLMAEHIAEDCYNQIAGTDMTAWFNDSTVRRLYVEGNVQLIMFPMETDSVYNKFAFVESSFMDAYFDANQIESIHFWPETTSKITPLYLARKGSYFLPKFQWYEDLRPFDKYDIFTVPAGMRELIDAAPPVRSDFKSKSLKNVTRPNPNAPIPAEDGLDTPTPVAIEEPIGEAEEVSSEPAEVPSEIPSEESDEESVGEEG